MSQEKRFQVFISSTLQDLREERQAVLKAVLQMKHMPAGMELFSASDEPAWQLIQKVINASDYYVLIIGGRYGSQDKAGIGFTEKEYHYAVRKRKPIIALLRDNPDSLRGKTDTDESAWQKLQAFRLHVKTHHYCNFWSSAGELQAQVITGLTDTISPKPAQGWVRANHVLSLRRQVRELRAQLRQARISPASRAAVDDKQAQLRAADLNIRSKLAEARRDGVRILIALKDTTYAMERIRHGQPYVRAAAAEVLAAQRHKDAIRLLISGLHFHGGSRNRVQIIPNVEKAFTHYGRSALWRSALKELVGELPTEYFYYRENLVWIAAMANTASDDVEAAQMLLAEGAKSARREFLAAALQTKFVFTEDQAMETINSYVNASPDDDKPDTQRFIAEQLAKSPTGATRWARRVVRRWVKLQVAACAPDKPYPRIERAMAVAALEMKAVSGKDIAKFALLTDNSKLRRDLQAALIKASNDVDKILGTSALAKPAARRSSARRPAAAATPVAETASDATPARKRRLMTAKKQVGVVAKGTKPMADIRASLAEFGADPAALRLLDEECPELLPYATLLAARRNRPATLGIVEAVYEWQGVPLAFVIDADSLEDDGQLHRIRRLLAMRGDAPYLGVVAPGQLRVYRIALDSKSLRQVRVGLEDTDGARSTVFARLGNVRPQAAIRTREFISNVVLSLLDGSTTRLIELAVSHHDAISLVGRALFTRFLADRSLLPESMAEPRTAAGLFDTREVTEETSDWLDATFNGDLLPLSAGIFAMLPARAYGILGDVLRRAPDSQLFLGWEEKWGSLDFAHIPVGVLSQAYELYLRKHAPAKQKREGGYFTPRPIAELMVRASFRALERRDAGKSARVLDPAVGGGIFLLTAFRELVAEHWRANGKRPDTGVLRRILYQQMVGFDINEAALRFAALGLYLLSIELDPNPRPVDKLRFDDLRGTVLHRVKGVDEEEGNALGSLGPLVGKEHIGRYDLVIGNPPWASATQLPEWNRVCEAVARIAAHRGIANTAPPLPNAVLDLPFVWRAMEWAKPDGQIAFALHARLLFQQGDGMPSARQALFEALDVTSVVNGVELRRTKVWPQIEAPFCILFATNRPPGVEAGFRFISPRIEDSLNSAGSMRIDAMNAEVVASRQLVDTPEILKILFRGSKADLGIVERIRAQGHPTLAAFWRETIGLTGRDQLRGSGNGYQRLRASSQVRRKGDGLRGADASDLQGRLEITRTSFTNIVVDNETLNTFSLDPRSPLAVAGFVYWASCRRSQIAVSCHGANRRSGL